MNRNQAVQNSGCCCCFSWAKVLKQFLAMTWCPTYYLPVGYISTVWP